MTYYLISFPAAAMDVPAEELPAVGAAAHAVIRQAQDAGVYVFAGGIDDTVPAALVDADGVVTERTTRLDGGFTVLDLPGRAEAEQWAARIARACRAPQELRAFSDDRDR